MTSHLLKGVAGAFLVVTLMFGKAFMRHAARQSLRETSDTSTNTSLLSFLDQQNLMSQQTQFDEVQEALSQPSGRS